MNQVLLPADMMRDNTCLFTGHRFLSAVQMQTVYPPLTGRLRMLASSGFRYYVNGGAMGFDLLAARAVTELAEDGWDLRLVMVLPCRDQTARWNPARAGDREWLRLYHAMKERAYRVVYLYDFYTDGCMQARNRFMTEHSSRCIAYWDGFSKGGTAQTIRMVQQAGLTLYNLYGEDRA